MPIKTEIKTHTNINQKNSQTFITDILSAESSRKYNEKMFEAIFEFYLPRYDLKCIETCLVQ